jgi:RNase P subunit RPR2
VSLPPDVIEEMMWRGVTPPPPGSNRTSCPACHTLPASHSLRRHRVVRVYAVPGGYNATCHHCGWADWFAAQERKAG